MLEIDIPGTGLLRLQHLVLDYNGTLATDGALLPGVDERARTLAARFIAPPQRRETGSDPRAGV